MILLYSVHTRMTNKPETGLLETVYAKMRQCCTSLLISDELNMPRVSRLNNMLY